MANQAPIVTVNAFETVLLNTAISASSLFSVTDPDGDPILSYRFMDFSSAGDSGYFELNGSALTNGSVVEIDADDLGNLSYIGGSVIDFEDVRIQAWDGEDWSNYNVTTTLYTTQDQTTRPIIEVADFSVLANESVAALSFISAHDPDGYPIQRYFLKDNAVDTGYFMLGDTMINQGEFHYFSPAEMENLRYYATDSGRERITAFAYDGSVWSRRDIGVSTIVPNTSRPTVIYGELTTPIREAIDVAPYLTFDDADGNTFKSVRFWDTSDHSYSGYLMLDGVELAAKQWNEISIDDLARVQYVGADRGFNERINVRVYDGQYWSRIQGMTFKTIVQPVLASDRYYAFTQLETTSISGIFDQLDIGPVHTQFQIADMTVSSGPDVSGYLSLNGDKLAAQTVYDMTADQFAQTTFTSGPFEALINDEIFARAWNGTVWSEWTRVNLATHPEYKEALMFPFGGSYLDWNDFSSVLPGPSTLSYSFMQQFPGYDSGDATADSWDGTFTSAQRNGARRGFAQLSSVANVTFVEVADSQIQERTGWRGGILRLGNYYDEDSDAAAYAFVPGPQEVNGDMWFNTAFISKFNWAPGSRSYTTFLHELGHAMGLKHPFNGNPILPPASDSDSFTVMSYTGRDDFLQPSTYMMYDIFGLQQLYGPNMSTATGDDVYSIATTFGTQASVQTIWDAGGVDLLSAEGADAPAVVDLREGRFSSIGTALNNIGVAFGVSLENGLGSDHDDVMYGNEYSNNISGGLGNDMIEGLGGNDFFNGGANNDTFVVGIGDGFDTINENKAAGRDLIEIRDFPDFNDFSTDLSFRREDRDLIIEYTQNQGEAQGGVRVVNQVWGGSRIESLTIGADMVDLSNLYAQTTEELQRFQITDDSSAFGSLVVPV